MDEREREKEGGDREVERVSIVIMKSKNILS